MLKQLCKSLFVGLLVASADYGLFGTPALAQYSDQRLKTHGSDLLAAENVLGSRAAAEPGVTCPADSWTTSLNMGEASNDLNTQFPNSVFSGSGSTGTIAQGTAATATINTEADMKNYFKNGTISYQYVFHVVGHHETTGVAKPYDVVCTEEAYNIG